MGHNGRWACCKRCVDRGIIRIGFLKGRIEVCPDCNGDPEGERRAMMARMSPPPPPPPAERNYGVHQRTSKHDAPTSSSPPSRPDEGMDLLTTVAVGAILYDLFSSE